MNKHNINDINQLEGRLTALEARYKSFKEELKAQNKALMERLITLKNLYKASDKRLKELEKREIIGTLTALSEISKKISKHHE